MSDDNKTNSNESNNIMSSNDNKSIESLSSNDAAKVKKQIEFYFSDSNYPRDKFLLEKAKNHKDGFIDLNILATFNRLKSITTNIEQIAKAIEDSEVVMLNDDRTMIKRSKPLPEVINADSRTIFITGAPKDKNLDDFETFFSTKGGKINAIRICKDKKTKTPTGVLFLEFNTEEDAKSFAELKTIKWDENEMIVKTKEQSLKDKKEKLLGKRKEPEVEDYTKDIIVQFTGLPEDCNTSAIQLKNFFKTIADAKYVEFIKGDTEGYIRCENPEEAKKLINSSIQFQDKITLSYSLLSGENEKMFWLRLQKSKRSQKGGKRKNRRY